MPHETRSDAAPLPTIPLALGVTGHLELSSEDDVALREAVRKVLHEVKRHCPHTSTIEVLSSLAEGADKVVAEEALKAGCWVRAPLPFPPDVYEASTSFRTDDGRRWFRTHLEHPRVSWFVVPLPDGPDTGDEEAWRKLCADAKTRRECYANAGGYVVRHCLGLIALWDGGKGDPLRPSGTAEMVDFKLNGALPQLYPWRQPLLAGNDLGPVVVIHAPRSGESAHQPAGTIRVLVPPIGGEVAEPVWREPLNPWRWLWWRVRGALGFTSKRPHKLDGDARVSFFQFLETVRSIDEFNRDLEVNRTGLAGRLQEATRGLLAEPAWVTLVEGRGEFDRLARVRSAAASMANTLEAKLKWLHRGLFLAIFVALAFLHLYAHGFEVEDGHTRHSPVWLGLFLLSLLAAVVVVCLVWYWRLDVRRLDYRALAEAVRVRYFWGLSGIEHSVADSYLSQLRIEMFWTRRALQSVSPPALSWKALFEKRPPDEQRQCLECVGERWVREQKRWFHDNHNKRHCWAVRYRRIGLAMALLGWLLAASLLARGCQPHHRQGVESPGSGDPPAERGVAHQASHPPSGMWHPAHEELILFSLFVIGGGLLIGYCERQSHEALARQYDNMHQVFGRAEQELGQHLTNGDLAGARKVIEALGREALVEHAHWLVIRRVRPFELVIGG